MARLYRHRLHRPDRHGVFALPGRRSGDKEAFLWSEAGYRISLARDLQMAGSERSPAGQKISGRGELRRVSRAADHALFAIHARRRDEWPGAGESISEPRGRRRRLVADSLVDRPAVD